MDDQYSVAIIGCGKRGHSHANGYDAEPRCRITCVADIDREAAGKLAAEHDADAAVYEDHRRMLDACDPEIVSICLPTGLHLPVFRDCAEAGVRAVFSEKPMAPTWGESQEMGRIARDDDIQLTFCHQRRFNPGIWQAREWMREGRFGELRRMDLFSPRNLLDCGTHTLDMGLMMNEEVPARWVMGQIDVREVRPYFGVPGEHVAVGVIRFENGVRATLEVGEDSEKPTGMRLRGTEGFLEVSWGGKYGDAAIYSDPDWQPPEQETPDAMPAAVRNNVDCLESGEEPELSVEKALRAAEIIFAIFESSRSRARIELPLETTDSALLSMLESGEIGPRE